VEHGESSGDAVPGIPDGPPPAREQLPLPRRRRQSHLEPQLRSQDEPDTGTPFAAFSAFSPAPDRDPAQAARPPMPDRGSPSARPFEQPDRPERPEPPEPPDRAAAFHAGTRRGRGAGSARRGSPPRRTDRGQPFARPPEY
jgi:hypothetical protein